jgi:hypothetical protein
MTEPFEKAGQEAAAFQKLWLETFSKAMQAAFKFTPDAPPPEILRQIREGIFQSLAESWDEFLRSPQFLDGMRQWMDNAIAFRKITNEFMARARNDLQAPSSSDIDTVLLAVRHMEKRVLDRLDQMSAQIADLGGKNGKAPRRRQPRSRASQPQGASGQAPPSQRAKGRPS